VKQNAPADRELSARLYGGDQQMRISQEIVLGIGGVRALRALGLSPTVWHLNEGHAAFLQVERVREFVQDRGLPFQVALWSARCDALFTTHTPVPAGNDVFSFDLIDRFFSGYWGRLGLDREQFLDLGRHDSGWGQQFSMTVLALRTAGLANGVSRLHGEVARRMWRDLWPELPIAEVPIEHVTNGVHTDTWLHPGMAALLDRYLDPDWRRALDRSESWAGAVKIPDDELWSQLRAAKSEMLVQVRLRLAHQLRRTGAPMAEVSAAEHVLDPNALTIGFARRFATYKRSTLLFRDLERLGRLLSQPGRPVQVIFAGKAHPADEPGKALIQTIYRFSRQPAFAGKVVFVENYDAALARSLVSGVDVWLNTPRRPLEASGTSGQKAGLNGVPNCSVLDGWWAEGYDGRNGWAIGREDKSADEAAQDEADARSLYQLLEDEIIPLYYHRSPDGLPTEWLKLARASIMSVGPRFSFDRMLEEYVNRFYVVASDRGARMRAEDYEGARGLAGWQQRVVAAWPSVRLTATGPTEADAHLGKPITVQAVLDSGSLSHEELAVELVSGRGGSDDLADVRVLPMHRDNGGGSQGRYTAELVPNSSGVFAYGVRVRPAHADLPNPFALNLVRWA
jgi:starch phosphorylase